MIPTRGQFVMLPSGQRAKIERVVGCDKRGRWEVIAGGKAMTLSWAKRNPGTGPAVKVEIPYGSMPSRDKSYQEILRQFALYNDDADVRHYYDKLGADFTKPLGAGYYGTTFASTDDEWVVKLTGDEHEARMVNVVRRLRAAGHGAKLRGIVAYKSDAVAAPRSKSLWVIVRENINPRSGVAPADSQWIYENCEAARRVRNWGDMAIKPRSSRQYEIAMEYAISMLKNLDGIEFRAFVETMAFMWDRGLPPADAHNQNIGRTIRSWFGRPSGSLVVYDYGAVKTTKADAPPHMKRMSRIMKTPKRKHKTQLRFGFSKQRIPRSEKWRSK